VKTSGAPSVGDIVEIAYDKSRIGLVVDTRGMQVGIRYFKPSTIPGTPPDFIWWIHRTRIRIVSAA